MALHEIPVDGHKHLATRDCPCGPKAGKTRGQPVRTVYRHQAGARKAAWAAELPPSEPAAAGDDHDETYGGAQ